MVFQKQEKNTFNSSTSKKLPDANKLILKYISAGVACHALLVLDKLGLVQELKVHGYIEKSDLKIIKQNKLLLDTALQELELNGLLERIDDRYYWSEFGLKLQNYIGLIYYVYFGYASVFGEVLKKENFALTKASKGKLINDSAIVAGSDSLADNFINPILVKTLLDLDIEKGLICDLGCGDCSRLNLISQITNLKGIGIDLSKQAIQLAEKILNFNNNISVIQDDIVKLKKSYPKVNVLMQTMVMHDFEPNDYCIDIMKSYLKKFPNMEYFLYCDIVAPSNGIYSQLPGFDYIHAMLGIKTKTYDETVKIIKDSGYGIVQEIAVEKLPNMFLWVLKPVR